MSDIINNARALAVVAALALTAAAAGCGSGGSSSATSLGDTTPVADGAPASGATTAREKAVKFAACIRAHGVADFPDPNAHNDFEYGVSVSPAVWRRAVDACKALQPPGTLSSKRTPTQQSSALRFAKCIRAHGVKDFPDPVNGQPLVDTTKIPSTDAPGGMDVLNAAMTKCKQLVAAALADR